MTRAAEKIGVIVAEKSNNSSGNKPSEWGWRSIGEEKWGSIKETKDTEDEIKETGTLENEQKTGPQDSRKLWVDIISGNRNPCNGMVIEFVTPNLVNGKIEIEIEEADIEKEVKFWDFSFIMYVLGAKDIIIVLLSWLMPGRCTCKRVNMMECSVCKWKMCMGERWAGKNDA